MLLFDVWQNGDYSALPSICKPDVRRHHDRLPAVGIADYSRIIELYRAAFADLSYQITEMVAEGSRVAVAYKVTGTHAGALGNIAATGVRDSITCFDLYLFDDGALISDIWTSIDELGLLMKLGIIAL